MEVDERLADPDRARQVAEPVLLTIITIAAASARGRRAEQQSCPSSHKRGGVAPGQ